jgi:hypothetical protein
MNRHWGGVPWIEDNSCWPFLVLLPASVSAQAPDRLYRNAFITPSDLALVEKLRRSSTATARG